MNFIKSHIKNWSALFLLLLTLFSCQTEEEESGKLKILSSFSILTEIIQEIGGEKVIVHNLVPVGMAPHNYEPRPADVMFATNADLIIYNGLDLEGGEKGWLMKLAKTVKMNSSKIYIATEGIEAMYLKDEEGNQEENPHAFISPKVGLQMIKNICKILMKEDPENAEYYQQNTNRYLQEIQTVEQEYQKRFDAIPKKKKVFVASEQAFQYLARDYGLKEGYIWAIDTEKNGTPQQMKNLIHFIKENQPSVLFIESNVDRRPMEIVSKSTGVPIYSKPVFSDELGRKGHPADSYLKYLQYNLEVICDGLR